MKKITIFGFPHAGGGAHQYLAWTHSIKNNFGWQLFDYAGHFSRADEPLDSSFEAAIENLTDKILAMLADQPFALFGHSMGAAMAYEVACRIQLQSPANLLKFILLSSILPPHLRDENAPRYYELDDENFVQHLLALGGISLEQSKNEKFIAYYLPLIKQDYQLYYHYKPSFPKTKLNCPAAISWGNREEHFNEIMSSWSDYFMIPPKFYVWPGGHFYWEAHVSKLTKIITEGSGNVCT